MGKNLIVCLLLFELFSFNFLVSSLSLNIHRSDNHEDQTGTLTPLVISLTSDDVKNKTTATDLIFVVDVSGSMSGTRITLVRETLNYIVDITNENDSIALVSFHSSATLRQGLVRMTEANKAALRKTISALNASGGTNIYSGLTLGLQQVKQDYSSGDRVCSIILLSDGIDQYSSADTKFASLISSQGKSNYIFTSHSFGYGSSHDAVLMSKISKIRDGGYFFIKEATEVKAAFIKIYGTLSTIVENNLQLKAQSEFKIVNIMGMEEMYQTKLEYMPNSVASTFTSNLMQVIGGKTYSFVALLDIPETTPYGEEVLNATIVGKNIYANYLWDNYYNPSAYEEYIRCVVSDFMLEGYNAGQTKGQQKIENSIDWVKYNYDGNFNWEGELTETIYDFKNFNSYGKANILSKLRELKSQKVGIHYSHENSFVDELIKDETDIGDDVSQEKKITTEQKIPTESNKNYYYFYLKEGMAELNGTHFSGKHSSIVIYTDKTESMNLKPLTAEFVYNYQSEKKGTRVQNLVDIGRGSKFIFKKDFPFDFYARVDGKNDILFNFQLTNLEYTEVQNEIPSFQILAYILPESTVTTLSSKNYNYNPSSVVFNGYYDQGSRIGKIFIKKEEITRNMNYNSVKNFLYIVVQKTTSSKIVYTRVEGQFSFIEMNFYSRNIPEGFYIFNNLSPGQRNPHQYTILLDPNPGKETRIEFAASSNELTCKVLKYNSYVLGSEELYNDYNELDLRRESRLGKTYIYVTQTKDTKKIINEVILSVFPDNEVRIAGTDYSKLEYSLRYTRDFDNGIYDYKDINEKNCEFNIETIEGNQEKLKVDFYPIKSKRLGEQDYVKENTRFYLKVYTFDKKFEAITGTLGLFEHNTPLIFIEKKMDNEEKLSINLDINRDKNYLVTLYSIIPRSGEIIGYPTEKLYKIPINFVITDSNSFENEYNSKIAIDFDVSQDVQKTHLLIETKDLDDGESVTIKAFIDGEVFEGQNKVQIPSTICKGKNIKVEISSNYEEEEQQEYYLKIYMITKEEITSDIKNYATKKTENIIHENSEHPKVYTNDNGDIIVVSSVIGKQETKFTKIDKNGNLIIGPALMEIGYTSEASLIQPYNFDSYVIIYHNKQDLEGQSEKEIILTMKDDQTVLRSVILKEYIYIKSSSIPLENGNILIAGIIEGKLKVEINIYNPKTGVIGDTLSINDYVDHISCYEQIKNHISCIYVSKENDVVSHLRTKEILVDATTLKEKSDRVIKSFNSQFNYLKAIRYNDNEGIILFQIEEKNLYYCHVKSSNGDDAKQIKRYEHLYSNCRFDENNTADVAILSKFKIFAVCETEENKFKGFIIHQNFKKVEEFDFNNYDTNEMRTPVFANFGNSLGLFYTSIDENSVKSVKYHTLNYPDCSDFTIMRPPNHDIEFNFLEKVFLSNPYPVTNKEDIKVRFGSYSQISITENLTNQKLTQDLDYPAVLSLLIKSEEDFDTIDIEFTATKEDPLDGIFLGKTCKMKIVTPKCLEQCESCAGIGTEEHHMCLGCKEGPYYYEEDPDAKTEGGFTPHFCKKCDPSCSKCEGGFLEGIPTTNCLICDYENNYFNYEDNEYTCISVETKEKWEKLLDFGLYLDSTPGEENKDQWRWRKCHKNCASCSELGDDDNNKCTSCKKNNYFFFNQTTENGGIPGTCYSNYEEKGFYVKEENNMEKYYPCSKNCKKCKNDKICEKCYPEFFRKKSEENEENTCEAECGYCLVEDRDNWECVNCKTDFPEPMFTLNNSCVKDIPFIDFLSKYHHIVDDKCNLLMGCKDGCQKCSPWYSDQCTECESSYYEEDFFGKEAPETFHCYTADTCKGIEPYIHDKEKEIAGIPKNVEGKNVCWNCKLRNGDYRLPDRYECGEKPSRTYVENDEYNTLSYCYYKCQECQSWGNSIIMNCTSCRDSLLYTELVKIGDYYNCERKPPNCGGLPFYHNYDYGEELGLENCGEDCDICMSNYTCPPGYQYIISKTKECVEYCPLIDILEETCEFLDEDAGMNLLANPWGLRDKDDLLNDYKFLDGVNSNKFLKYTNEADEGLNNTGLNGFIGNGEIYNLKESKLIKGKNMAIELTSVKLEIDKLQKILSGELPKDSASILDLSECEKLLKEKYNLKDEEELVIIKGDILDESSEYYSLSRTEYQIFSVSMGVFLSLDICKNAKISTQSYTPLETSLLGKSLQEKPKAVLEEDYNLFNPNSEFYNDICTPFTNENGNDVLLFYRRNEYFNSEYNLCEQGCDFIGYNETIKLFTCNCSIKDSLNDVSTYEVTPMVVPEEFYSNKEENSNIQVIKCSTQVFSIKGQKMNLGSYILIFLFFSFIITMLIYFIRGRTTLEAKINGPENIIKEDKIKENTEKEEGGSVNDDDVFDEVLQTDFKMTEDDLNYVDYVTAKQQDQRGFCKNYLFLLKLRQYIIFTFWTSNDHNLRVVKISLFILFVTFSFVFTALFFSDNILKDIYLFKGSIGVYIRIINIILASVCCIIINLIIRLVTLSEVKINKAVLEKNPILRTPLIEGIVKKLKIKLIVFYIISIILIALSWYYVASFCAVFKNSQVQYLINVAVVFVVCNLWTCVICLIAPILRTISLKKGGANCLYKSSQIISYF